MPWVLGLMGAFVGVLAGEIAAGFLGLIAGALLGWQAARVAELRRRVAALEAQQRAAAIGSGTPQESRPRTANLSATARQVPANLPPQEPAHPASGIATNAAAEAGQPGIARPPTPDPAATRATPADLPQPAAAPAGSRASAAPAAGARVPPRIPPRRPARREPDWFDRLARLARRWLFEGNVPVKLGVLVLFFGVAAAIKYAVDQGWVALPIEFRLGAFALLALGGLVWGWRNRIARPAFGLSLQGGAIGVLLLIVFGAYRVWDVLPAGIAFGLVLGLVAGAALLAVLQRAVALAVLGFVGGYLAPVLISTGSGNHVALFTYYALLNAAVFGIAWVRAWRPLNLIGFAFTFAIGTMWGARSYRPEHFATVEPFLILFFLFYVAIAVLHALRSPGAKRGFVDGTLVFGTPLLAFPLQAAMLADDRMLLAYSALAVALLYAALATWLIRRRDLGLLGQSFAALAVGFATLAIPLALSARWTSASWAVEGAALIWLGLRQRRLLPQLAGWALQAFAAAAYFAGLTLRNWDALPGEWPVLNGETLCMLTLSLSAFFISWLYEHSRGHRGLVWLGFAIGTGWWSLLGLREVFVHFDHLDIALAFTAFGAISTALAGVLRGALRWPRLGWLVILGAAFGLVLAFGTLAEIETALAWPAIGYWLAWFAAALFALWRLRDPEQRAISLAHVAVLFTAVVLFGGSLYDFAIENSLASGWRTVLGWMPLVALLLLTWRAPILGAFPLADRFPRYRLRWFVPALALLAVGWTASLFEAGNAAPLPFVPVINPLELFQLGILLTALLQVRARGAHADGWRPALAIATFAFVSFAGLRAVHHLHGAPWSESILDNSVAQATLTVLWTLLGVAAWIDGSRRRLWNVWLTGAILMGVVLVKLVLVDRQYWGNLAGIISMLTVGGLLVLVGRIAPTPPRTRTPEPTDDATGTASKPASEDSP